MYLHFKNWHSASLLLKYRDVSWKTYFNVVCSCMHACVCVCARVRVCVLCIWTCMRSTGATLRNTVLFGDNVLAGGQQLTSEAEHDSPSVRSQGHTNPCPWAQEMELGPCPCPCPCKASSLQSEPSSPIPIKLQNTMLCILQKQQKNKQSRKCFIHLTVLFKVSPETSLTTPCPGLLSLA